jgi:uncharacterized protein
MSEIDQQFIEYVVKSLVGKPDAVQIERRIDEKGVLLELTVDPEDLGRLIGKRGATAQSLRTLLRALGTKNDARYNLKIVDNGVGGHAGSVDGDSAAPRPAKRDDKPADDTTAVADEPADNVADEVEQAADPAATETSETATSDEDQASDRLKRTRAELADLDDLDV